jgi:TonB family protein
LRLPKDARLRPAIRTRWAAVLIAILASPLCSFVSSSTVAFGMPQSGNAGSKRGISGPRAANRQISLSPPESAEDASTSRKGVIPTRENLQLTVKADCANVQIFADAANEVRYSLRLDPKIAGADADALLREVWPIAHNTPRGVLLIGHARESDCGVNVTYQIHVPRRYDLDIAVQSGDIVTQDIDGVVVFATGGGNIRAGRVGTGDAASRTLAGAAFTAQLETAGGDISIGDVAGGLRAATAGGQISARDVHGPAVLRTGGGDIRVGHVFGAAHFTSGGGDIIAEKVDGGVRADMAGGRVEIGNAVRVAAVAPQFPAGGRDAFPTAVPRRLEDQQAMPAMSDLAEVTEFARLFDVFLWGGIRVDPADQQKRLVNSIAPEYPDVARLAGIEGDVTLRIFVGRDGRIRDVMPISGPPVLARAAMHAVEQWRYAPALIDGHPVDVVTTVTLAFRLYP